MLRQEARSIADTLTPEQGNFSFNSLEFHEPSGKWIATFINPDNEVVVERWEDYETAASAAAAESEESDEESTTDTTDTTENDERTSVNGSGV